MGSYSEIYTDRSGNYSRVSFELKEDKTWTCEDYYFAAREHGGDFAAREHVGDFAAREHVGDTVRSDGTWTIDGDKLKFRKNGKVVQTFRIQEDRTLLTKWSAACGSTFTMNFSKAKEEESKDVSEEIP